MIVTEDVLVYVDSVKEPVIQMSKIELSKSKLMAGLMTSLNICDGCSQPVSIIITGEEKQTVVSSLSQIKAKAGLSIITASGM